METRNSEFVMGDNVPLQVASRRDQMFPALADAEIARIRRFGSVQRYARGARLFAAGEPGPGMFVVLKGVVTISQHDGLGHVVPIVRQGRGQFLAEVGQLSGGFALVDGYADEDVETLLVPPGQLRALIIAEADLGERIVRALILRRVALTESRTRCCGCRISCAAMAIRIMSSTRRMMPAPPRFSNSTVRRWPMSWSCCRTARYC
jgi:CRP-like cAMP-binding protein